MSSEDRREEADQVEEVRDGDMSGISDVNPKEADEGPAEEDTEKRMEEELAALQADLERACVERDQYLDHMRRLKAELDNSRKRMERERSRIIQMASENLVKELLPVLDNLERALESTGDISEGIRATRDQLLHILQREGLTPIASDGQHFDPVVHEAVVGQPAEEQEEDTVIQTLQKGYLLNGKPIRPAKVVVAK